MSDGDSNKSLSDLIINFQTIHSKLCKLSPLLISSPLIALIVIATFAVDFVMSPYRFISFLPFLI